VTKLNVTELTYEARKVGKGASGTVHQAFDMSGGVYAVKMFNDGNMSQREARQHMKFMSELTHVRVH